MTGEYFAVLNMWQAEARTCPCSLTLLCTVPLEEGEDREEGRVGVREELPYLRLSDGAFGGDVNAMHARVAYYEQQRPELSAAPPLCPPPFHCTALVSNQLTSSGCTAATRVPVGAHSGR